MLLNFLMGLQIGDIITKKEIQFSDLQGKTIAIDAFNAIYQFLTTIRQPDGTPLKDSKERVTSHLSGIFYRNISLLAEGIKLIYVFDGKAPSLKEKTYVKRQEARDTASEKYEVAKKEEDFEGMRKKFDFLVATSGIRTSQDDHIHRLGISSKELVKKISTGEKDQKVGIVFGPEDVGLTNDETTACDLLVQIPTSEEYPIMNLSHAVGILLYELSTATLPKFRIASQKELEVLDEEMDNSLEGWNRKDVVKLIFKRIFGRAVLSGREVNTLIGFFRKVKKGKV